MVGWCLASARSARGSSHEPGRCSARPAAATGLLVTRNYIVYKDAWKLFLTGFFEPFFYLLSIGIGVGQLIDTFEFNGQQIPYAEFVAPGMLAASAFNGALIDATFNTFFKLKFVKLYDQMLATPLTTSDVARGEIVWSQLRGGTYAAAFLVIMTAMGLVHSWWAVLALPATLLIGFAFAAVCMAATTYMTSWQDFDKITLVQLPLFLFSGTFFPITAFHGGPVGRRVHAALPRRRAVPRAHHRCAHLGLGGLGRLPGGDGAGRPGRRAAAARQAPAHLAVSPRSPGSRTSCRRWRANPRRRSGGSAGSGCWPGGPPSASRH